MLNNSTLKIAGSFYNPKNYFLLKFMQIILGNLKSQYLHSCTTYEQKVIFGNKNDYLGKFDQIPGHAVSLPV